MTKFQWQVILALIRIVLKIQSRTDDSTHEWFDIQTAQDTTKLEEALKREREFSEDTE